MSYIDDQIVVVHGTSYVYSASYDRLERREKDKHGNWTGMHCGDRICPAIRCPKCLANEFTITYGDFECIANCYCGHSMTIYDG